MYDFISVIYICALLMRNINSLRIKSYKFTRSCSRSILFIRPLRSATISHIFPRCSIGRRKMVRAACQINNNARYAVPSPAALSPFGRIYQSAPVALKLGASTELRCKGKKANFDIYEISNPNEAESIVEVCVFPYVPASETRFPKIRSAIIDEL